MRTRAVYFTAMTHYLQEDYYIIIILYGFGQCFAILQEKTVWKRSKLSTKERYEQISWLAAHVKLHLVLSAFREHRGGADPRDGEYTRGHTYANQALPVDADSGETSLSTVLLPSPKSIFKNVKCCHSTNGEAEVLKDAKMCLRLPRLTVGGAPWSPRTPPCLPGLWPIEQSGLGAGGQRCSQRLFAPSLTGRKFALKMQLKFRKKWGSFSFWIVLERSEISLHIQAGFAAYLAEPRKLVRTWMGGLSRADINLSMLSVTHASDIQVRP